MTRPRPVETMAMVMVIRTTMIVPQGEREI